MTQTYKISKKQTLLDACIQVYGTAKLLFQFASDNGLSIDSVVDIGDELTYDDVLGVPKMKRKLNRSGSDVMNEGDSVGSTIFGDWFLPSLDLLEQMNLELNQYGVGNFATTIYWSSSERTLDTAHEYSFSQSLASWTDKFAPLAVRACRSFEDQVGAYSLRDVGPGGGLIFYISGTTYKEAAPSDQSAGHSWSNIDNVLIGTTGTAIGTGQANTSSIIAQPGHTSSAAKLCNDLVV